MSLSSSTTTTTTTTITSLDVPVLCVFNPLDCCRAHCILTKYPLTVVIVYLYDCILFPLSYNFHDYDVIYTEFVVDGCTRYQVMCWLLFYFHSLYMSISEQQFVFCSLPNVYSLSSLAPYVTPHHSTDITSNVPILRH